MRLDANKGNCRNWVVYHAEECRVLHQVIWVDDETAQWCEAFGVTNGELMTRINQATKIAIMVERRTVIINPIEEADEESIASMEVSAI